MNADVAAQVLFWLAFAAILFGIVYLAHRLTAPVARRMNEGQEQRHYAWLATRGRDVALPRTWLSGGVAGHDWNTDPEFSRTVKLSGLAIFAAFALGIWMRSDTLSLGHVLGEAAFGLVVVGFVFFGLRFYGRQRVKRALMAAGDLAPRGSFKVVANAHGLFVPVADRVVEGAWQDWLVTDVEIDFDKYGRGFCHAITLTHRASPAEKIPVIASTFQNGDELMAVLAARVPRRADVPV